MHIVEVEDDSGLLRLRFAAKSADGDAGADIMAGQLVRASGKARQGRKGVVMIDPTYTIVDEPDGSVPD